MSVRSGDVFTTSDRPRVVIPPCAPHVRSHAAVLFSAGDNVIRQRALDELKRIADEDPRYGAAEVLAQFTATGESLEAPVIVAPGPDKQVTVDHATGFVHDKNKSLAETWRDTRRGRR